MSPASALRRCGLSRSQLLFAIAAIVVGGVGSFWGPFVVWAAMGYPGWGCADVQPVSKMSEDDQRLGNDPLHGSGGPLHVDDAAYIDRGEHMWLEAARKAGHKLNRDFNGPDQEGAGFFQFVIKGGERWGRRRPISGRRWCGRTRR